MDYPSNDDDEIIINQSSKDNLYLNFEKEGNTLTSCYFLCVCVLSVVQVLVGYRSGDL